MMNVVRWYGINALTFEGSPSYCELSRLFMYLELKLLGIAEKKTFLGPKMLESNQLLSEPPA